MVQWQHGLLGNLGRHQTLQVNPGTSYFPEKSGSNAHGMGDGAYGSYRIDPVSLGG